MKGEHTMREIEISDRRRIVFLEECVGTLIFKKNETEQKLIARITQVHFWIDVQIEPNSPNVSLVRSGPLT